ncbi:MAG TPA: DUF6585 family protein [Ktedonobacteraceae bacterium]|jgi:hypothetical protein|nr:DUF6585 family protein [Ktedonobacteraceae bacterium]
MRRIPVGKLPPKISQYAAQQQLGVLQRIYEWGAGWLSIVLSMLCFLLSGLLIAGYLYYSTIPTFLLPLWQTDAILFISGCWLLLGAWLLLTPAFTPLTRLYIFSKGLLYYKRKAEVIHWQQIAQFWKEEKGTGKFPRIRYTLQRDDGKTFTITSHLAELTLLGDFLDHTMTRRQSTQQDLTREQMPQLSAYDNGQVVPFGALSLGKQGIFLYQQHVQMVLAWNEVASIGVGEHEVIIRRKCTQHEWYVLPIWAVAHTEELKALVNHIVLHQFR